MPINKRLLALMLLVAAVCSGAQEPAKKEPEPARDVVIERLETTYRYQWRFPSCKIGTCGPPLGRSKFRGRHRTIGG